MYIGIRRSEGGSLMGEQLEDSAILGADLRLFLQAEDESHQTYLVHII